MLLEPALACSVVRGCNGEQDVVPLAVDIPNTDLQVRTSRLYVGPSGFELAGILVTGKDHAHLRQGYVV